jgi:hypothetical protein
MGVDAAVETAEPYTTTQVEVITVTVVPTPGACAVGNGSGVAGSDPMMSNGTALSSESGGRRELRWGLGGVLGVLGFAFWAL